jgi:NADH:ubiquinone oxidoreductase subunit 2 (subunit N)
MFYLTLLLGGIVGTIQAMNQFKIKRFIAYTAIFSNTYFIVCLLFQVVLHYLL